MQTLSAIAPLAQAAQASTAAGRESLTQLVAVVGPLILFLATLLLVQIVMYWIASKIVAPDESRFTNALRVFGLYLLLYVVLGVAGAVFTPISAAVLNLLSGGGTNPGWVILLVVLIVLILGIFFTFLIPMRVYRISAKRAFVFLLISFILEGASGYALSSMFKSHFDTWNETLQQLARSPGSERRSFVREMTRQAQNSAINSAEKLASDPSRTLQERQVSLTNMYNQLEAMRITLPPGDKDAIAQYEQRRARYEEILTNLRAEVQANQPR